MKNPLVMRVSRRARAALFCLALLFSVAFALFAAPGALHAGTKVVRTLTADIEPWAKIECLENDAAGFVAEPFHPKSVHLHRSVKAGFGTEAPHSRFVLLHYAQGWDKATQPVPVLLVHGAGDNAFRGWCHPYEFEVAPGEKPKVPGLVQYLAPSRAGGPAHAVDHFTSRGFAVFAVTFSHPHGDNFLQAEQLAAVIARVKERMSGGADFQVDLVTHSKGAMAARIYASSLGEGDAHYGWLTPYRGDIRKIVFCAGPLKGIDTAFRYYMYNFTVMAGDSAAPMGPDIMTWLGLPQGLAKHNACFPGQMQMLHAWVDDGIPFTLDSATTDVNYSRDVLYRGGTSAFLHSRGIDRVKKEAGDVIARLNAKGVDPRIRIYALAGTNQVIDTVDLGLIKIPLGEKAAPSDGVLFVKSATYVDGCAKRGAKIGRVGTVPGNHLGVTFREDAVKFIEECLTR